MRAAPLVRGTSPLDPLPRPRRITRARARALTGPPIKDRRKTTSGTRRAEAVKSEDTTHTHAQYTGPPPPPYFHRVLLLLLLLYVCRKRILSEAPTRSYYYYYIIMIIITWCYYCCVVHNDAGHCVRDGIRGRRRRRIRNFRRKKKTRCNTIGGVYFISMILLLLLRDLFFAPLPLSRYRNFV